MISVADALLLVSFGSGLMLVGISAGHVLHMRWLDRKLIKPVSKATQQLPAVKVKRP